MNCPNCVASELSLKNIEDDLTVLECRSCGGYWLQASQYWEWKENYNGFLKESGKNAPTTNDSSKPEDSNNIKRCPECSRMLNRYKVGNGVDFYIERCESCQSVWFDKNEWEQLKTKDIHDEIHLIFSSYWQNEIKKN